LNSSSELERWDDWRLDEAWGDTDDDAKNNDFVEGTTKNTKTLNRSDPLLSPLEETEEGKEGKNREENIFSHQNAEEKGIAIAREKIDDENDDVKDDAEKEKERKYYLGYENDKRSKVLVEFWRSSFPEMKDFDVLNMMKLGQDYAKLRDCELVITMDQKLNALLPGVSVLNVLQRCPTILEKFDFGKASKRILEIQDVLCSEDYCHDVVDIVEKTPDLLLCESVYEEREKTIEKLNQMCNCTDTYEGGEVSKGIKIDAERTVAEYPELLYRLKEYDSYYDLPVSILNMLTGPNEDEILDEDYDQMWDQNMGGKSSGSNSFSNSTNSESYEEWQNDGYWEKEED
jgi:hypothetical protein|tara:strand:+ start:9615 stop:10646 length:1032 start_codon:yes stop_codon:yes gene_type:complete